MRADWIESAYGDGWDASKASDAVKAWLSRSRLREKKPRAARRVRVSRRVISQSPRS
jgi:hypothetical protein